MTLMMTRSSGPILIGFLLAPWLSGQPGQTFEVASVKVASSPNGVRGGCHGIDTVYTPGQQVVAAPLGRCVITDARLSHLIGIAYGVSMAELKTGPDWIQRGDLRFNVEAKAEDPKATERQLLTMLQNLLVERFQLKFHKETRDAAGFALTVAKEGPKLEPSKSAETRLSFKGPEGKPAPKPIPGQPTSMTVQKMSMPALVNLLTSMGEHGPWVDKTGLTGEYDFTLTWDEQSGPALSTALREQVGLRMESAKVPTSTIVIDSAEKPGAN